MGKSSWKRRVKAATENRPQESDSASRQALRDALNKRRERRSNHHGDHHHPHNGPCPHNHHGPLVAVKNSNRGQVTSNQLVFMCQAPGLGNEEEQDHRRCGPMMDSFSNDHYQSLSVFRPPIANGMMAAFTESGLADQIHEILTSVKALVYPSPIDMALRRRNVPFVESEDTLVILRSNIGATPARFMHEVLMNSKHKGTIQNIHFYLPYVHNEADQAFNFNQFTQQLTDQVPNCCYLDIRRVKARNFKLKSKTIKTLKLIDTIIQDETWEVNMPNLEELHMENHKPPAKNFAQALINSPLIKRFYAHKYWNEATFPPLYLPNCQRFIFRFGDSTYSLKLYLPQVEELTLDACYSMQKCELLTQGHPSHAQWNIALDKVPGTTFLLSLKNAGLSKAAISSLRKSGRVLNPKALEQKLDHSHAFEAYRMSTKMYMARDMSEAAKAGACKHEQLKHAIQMSWMRSDPATGKNHNSNNLDGDPPELEPTQPSQREMKKSRLWGVAASQEEDSSGGNESDKPEMAAEKIETIHDMSARDSLVSYLIKKARLTEYLTSKRKLSKTETKKNTTNPDKKLEDFLALITESRDRSWTKDRKTYDEINKIIQESGFTKMKEFVVPETLKIEAKDAGMTDEIFNFVEECFFSLHFNEEIKDYVLPKLCNYKPGKNEKSQHLQAEIKANKKEIEDKGKAAKKKLKTAKSKADHKSKEKSKKATKEIKMKSNQIMDLTEKTKKMAEKTQSGDSRKKSRKKRKPKGTSLTQYGVTSTKKELREMEWDWLFSLKTKIEKGRPLTLKDTTEGFPLNKLFYANATKVSATAKTQIKSNGNKKPAYTTNNLQLIQLLHASGFKFQHKAQQPAAPPVTPAKPLCPPSVTSHDYATFMERVIAKKLKEEAREARKQANMKAALMESMKKRYWSQLHC